MITCKDYKCLTKFLSLFLQYKMVKISATEILPHKVIFLYQKKYIYGSVRIAQHYILPIRIDVTPPGVNLTLLLPRFSGANLYPQGKESEE